MHDNIIHSKSGYSDEPFKGGGGGGSQENVSSKSSRRERSQSPSKDVSLFKIYSSACTFCFTFQLGRSMNLSQVVMKINRSSKGLRRKKGIGMS